MLRVIETHDRNQQWLGVADIMRAEAHEEANAVLDRHAARISSITGVMPQRVIREGDKAEEMLKLIDEDEDIAALILAAGVGKEGPGPLVTSLAKSAGDFPIPVAIVPGPPERRGPRHDVVRASAAPRSGPAPTVLDADQALDRPAWRLELPRAAPPIRMRMTTIPRGARPAAKEQTMFIQTEPTPNPATLKFLPGRAVLAHGTLDMRDKAAAAQSPLAERLFEIAGVSGVFFGSDFIAVTKADERMAAAQAGDPRRHHGALHVGRAGAAQRGATRLPTARDEFFAPEDTETVATIKELIETRVRPGGRQ